MSACVDEAKRLFEEAEERRRWGERKLLSSVASQQEIIRDMEARIIALERVVGLRG